MADCAVLLYWIPVAAGTSRFRRASLRCWEAFEAFRSRRSRAVLFHSALKVRLPEAGTVTLELAPAFVRSPVPALMTGPVGVRHADRLRLFRYELKCLPGDVLPDEEYAVASPIVLSEDCAVAGRILELAPATPRFTWGRRVPGTGEMWTSDSVVSWLLVKSGVDVSDAAPPEGGRAPGWLAGAALAEAEIERRAG